MPSSGYQTTGEASSIRGVDKRGNSARGYRRMKSLQDWVCSLSAYSIALICLLVIGLAATASSTPGQAVYGSIGGTVVDASGGGVGGAKVTITDLDRNIVHATETNGNGNYSLAHLIIGKYKVQVEMPGFKTSVAEVNVQVDTNQTVDMTLQPGDVKQTITVTDEMPLLKTERTDVSTTLTEMQVTTLPTFGRNFSELLLLTPGAVQFNWND